MIGILLIIEGLTSLIILCKSSSLLIIVFIGLIEKYEEFIEVNVNNKIQVNDEKILISKYFFFDAGIISSPALVTIGTLGTFNSIFIVF